MNKYFVKERKYVTSLSDKNKGSWQMVWVRRPLSETGLTPQERKAAQKEIKKRKRRTKFWKWLLGEHAKIYISGID